MSDDDIFVKLPPPPYRPQPEYVDRLERRIDELERRLDEQATKIARLSNEVDDVSVWNARF